MGLLFWCVPGVHAFGNLLYDGYLYCASGHTNAPVLNQSVVPISAYISTLFKQAKQ